MGVKFRRQHPIGNFFADFCCPERGLVIELDGAHHFDQAEADASRTAYLEARGYKVLRFWDNEVLTKLDEVVLAIANAL